MKDLTRRCRVFVSVLLSLDVSFVTAVTWTLRRILASIRSFDRGEVNPKSFERLERRLEMLCRELARLFLQHTVNHLEATKSPKPVLWEDRVHEPVRLESRTMETRVGTINYRRWIHQNEYCWVRSVAPLDHRLGLIGDRVSPGVAYALGRLAADQPQQAAIAQLKRQFGIGLSVYAYRSVVQHLACEIRYLQDNLAIAELLKLIARAREGSGKHEFLLLVGRDGVHVPMRQSWKEAACAAIAVYDKNRKRLGTVYLGEMPQKNQAEMIRRLTNVITGVLSGAGGQSLRLRYVTDAGGLPRSYFKNVLAKMKHPQTGQLLQWSWGVDFFHACEYICLLADTIFGVGTEQGQSWFREQRHTLRHHRDGVRKVLASAAQKKRRRGLKGSESDYQRGKGYLNHYRGFMDYAARRAAGDPIGSGVTEAGCKVIFNQRMKQSGMRWKRSSGQWIVDLRTACRSKLWDRIWKFGLDDYRTLPETTKAIQINMGV